MNWLLLPMIGIPYLILLSRHDRPMLLVFGVMIAILLFFTVLIRRMLRRGARSAPELMGRTLTFWWMVALLLISFTTHPILSYVFLVAISGLALLEYFSFTLPSDIAGRFWINAALLVCVATLPCLAALAYTSHVAWFFALVPLVCVLIIPIFFVLRDHKEGALEHLALIITGAILFCFGLGHSMLLQKLDPMVLIYCFLLTELRDLLSYWMGKGLSRVQPNNRVLHVRVAEQLSPNKTWLVGILSLFCIAGLAVALAPLLPIFPRGKITPMFAALIGAAIGFFGLMGDLVFSMIKRDAGIKDSGSWLPGGTGVIDRIDSLVVTVPVTFHLIYWFYIVKG